MRILKPNINSSKKSRVVAITAGGTGGHIFPALTIARMLVNDGFYILFYTDRRFFNYIKPDDIFIRSGMIKITVLKAKNAKRWKQILMIIRDFFSCYKILTKKASMCIGFGGLVSFAPMLFSILTLKKTIIHEQNAVIGTANKMLLPFIGKCLISFKNTIGIGSFKRKCIFTGNPVRNEIKKLVYNYDNPSVNYRAFYKIDDIINLTITGGSQACEAFDEIIPQAISMLPSSITNKLHVVHQCRSTNVDILKNFYTECGITHDVRPFFYNMGEIFRASHLVISRAGSTTISEISALGVPSILIPLPFSAKDHQFFNAKFLRDNNATILLEQQSLTKESLSQLLLNLFDNDYSLFELSQCCRKLAQVNADITIFNEIKASLNMPEEKYDVKQKTSIINAKYINDNVGLG